MINPLATIKEKIISAKNPEDVRFTNDEAAAYIPMKKTALAQLRYTGKGPKFYKPTERTVLYRKGDIDDWLNASIRTSTADAESKN